MAELKLPKIGYLVIATTSKILEHGAYFKLDEYSNLEAYMPIGEVSASRVFDINDVLKVNKKYVCKVIRVDKIKKHVDISLKRVAENEKKRKLIEWKRLQKANKLIELLSEKTGKNKNFLFKIFNSYIENKFEDLFSIFESVVTEGISSIKDMPIDENVKKELVKIANEHIKLKIAEVEANFSLISLAPNGIKIIKEAIDNGYNEISKLHDIKNIKIISLGAPKFKLTIIAKNYKIAEEALNKFEKLLSNFSHKNKLFFSFKRIKK